MSLSTRRAKPGDEGVIFGFIRALAAYERMSDQVLSNEADIAAALFGENPRVFCDLAFVGDKPAGFALWFYSFSTFRGKHGLYLEDLFVDPAFRGMGAGKALLASLARRCIDEGLPRFEWQVLDWNQPAIDFYLTQGAEIKKGWESVRLSDDALTKLASHAP